MHKIVEVTPGSAMTSGHVRIVSTLELSVQLLINRSQPSTQALPSIHFSDSGTFRRARLSKQQESQDSAKATENGRAFTSIKSFPSVSQASQDPNWHHGSLATQAELSGQHYPSRRKDVSDERPETRRRRSVFAELHDSDSAMGLTKKVPRSHRYVCSSSH